MPTKKKVNVSCAAAREGNADTLLAQLPSMSQEEKDNRLGVAAGHGHKQCVTLLLEHKALINARPSGSAYGRTALHEAAIWGSPQEVVKVLLDAKADPTLKAKLKGDLLDAHEMAEEKGHDALSFYMEPDDY